MNKKTILTIVAVALGVLAAIGAVASILYILDKKGKLRKTNISFSEEFPDEEPIVIEE